LSPTQVHIITISEKHKEYAATVESELKLLGVRVEVDDSDNTIGKKIRTHRKMQPAYMVILGDDEAANTTVSIRNRKGDQVQGIPLDNFLANMLAEIETRNAEQNLVLPQE
jgi:threonyl-tRNA synthetase